MNKIYTSLVIALFAWWGFIYSPGKAYAQGNTWVGASLQQMVDAARWKLGLLRINAVFTMANVGYDSGVYYGYLDEPLANLTLEPGVPIQILLPVSKKIVLDLFDSPQYVFYIDTKWDRGWNNVFQGRIHFAMERFYVQGGTRLSNDRHLFFQEMNTNIRQTRNRVEGLILWRVSRVTP